MAEKEYFIDDRVVIPEEIKKMSMNVGIWKIFQLFSEKNQPEGQPERRVCG